MKYMDDYLISILSIENRQVMAVYGLAILLLFDAAIIVIAFIGYRTRMLAPFAKPVISCKKLEQYKPPVNTCGTKTSPHKFEDNGKRMHKGFQGLLGTPSRMIGRS
jgi:hypothetical protein